jgi:hypothetical protein
LLAVLSPAAVLIVIVVDFGAANAPTAASATIPIIMSFFI